MYPNRARRNRRNRQLPSESIPPTAAQLNVTRVVTGLGGLDTNMLVIELDGIAFVPGKWGDLPLTVPGVAGPKWGGWYDPDNTAIVTTPTAYVVIEYEGDGLGGAEVDWPATPLIRSESGGILNAYAGTIVQE